MKILNKIDMYEKLEAGEFGNTFRTWPSVDAALADGYHGPYGMRTRKKGDKQYRGDMYIAEARKAEKEAQHLGVSICEYVPNYKISINGEITRTSQGLYLKYKEGPGYMKKAMQQPSWLVGVQVIPMLMKHDLGKFDLYNHLNYLLDTYEGTIGTYQSAVVEFAVFTEPVGIFKKNYIIWEVRSF